MFMRQQSRSGFTLLEIVFTFFLVVLVGALSLWTLRPGASKAPTQGLAVALADEFAAARRLAISSGRPVALCMPRDSISPLASSIYRLEGWNTPTVTWSKGFSGDYPSCGFAPARWSGGGSWTDGAPESVVSKATAFNLNTWLPSISGINDDYVFCFTPDGGLVTNQMPALDGRYVVVVGQHLQVTPATHGVTVQGAKDPVTIFVSPYGAVETVTGLPGGSVPISGGETVTSEPVNRTQHRPGEVRISNIKVRPALDANTGYCVPGQYVTLEVYAYDPEGRGLFAKWKQGTNKGIFTYPDGGAPSGAVLVSEVDRMEFVNEIIDDPSTTEDDVTWTGTDPPPGGLFRARWGFTVPLSSTPGTTYEIEVDVKDARGECEIVNRPPPFVMRVAPAGRMIGEMRVNGRWQLVQVNPDGSNPRVISPPGVEEVLASMDENGTKIAFLQGNAGNRYVKIRALDGAYERTVAGPGDFTSVSLSPNGTWVSYRDNGAGILITENAEGGNRFTVSQSHPNAPNPPRSRSGWTKNSRFLLFENDSTIHWRRLEPPFNNNESFESDPRYGTLVGGIINGGMAERLYAPTTYRVGDAGAGVVQERCMISLGNNDPVLISVPVDGADGSSLNTVTASSLGSFTTSPGSMNALMMPDIDGGGGDPGSGATDDSYPNISSDSAFLVVNRAPEFTPIDDADNQRCALIFLNANYNYVGPPQIQLPSGMRRAIWIPVKQDD
jgi:type II secretory pathway pseudopilin PulG